MDDLCALRGSLAHGKREGAYPSRWTRREHLLLAGFIFPLCVKMRLRTTGSYKLTAEDENSIYGVDYLLAAKTLLGASKDEYGEPIFGWVEALQAVEDKRRMAAVIAAWDQHVGKA